MRTASHTNRQTCASFTTIHGFPIGSGVNIQCILLLAKSEFTQRMTVL